MSRESDLLKELKRAVGINHTPTEYEKGTIRLLRQWIKVKIGYGWSDEEIYQHMFEIFENKDEIDSYKTLVESLVKKC
jgi:hypothetical protein